MRIWKHIKGFGVIDTMKVTAVGRYHDQTNGRTYDVHCGGVKITLRTIDISRENFLKLLPGYEAQPDEPYTD